jgi:hypothetical protein
MPESVRFVKITDRKRFTKIGFNLMQDLVVFLKKAFTPFCCFIDAFLERIDRGLNDSLGVGCSKIGWDRKQSESSF